MKKLMTMIAAVATAFGLFAADPVVTGKASFESTSEAGVSADKFDAASEPAAAAGWTWAGDPLTLGAYDGDEYDYVGDGNVRREEFAGYPAQAKFLELSTSKGEVLSHSIGDTSIFVDQLVKFTGFEDAPEVEGAKIAVWMSEFITDDETEATETNLYITAGTTPTPVKIDAPAGTVWEIGKWYRLTIKSLGVIDGDATVGFIVYVDGQQVASSEDAAKALINPSLLNDANKALLEAGQLFPAMTTGALASVGYNGIGAIDDLVIDDQGPMFARKIPFTVVTPDGLKILSIKDGEGNDVVPADGVANGTTVTVTYGPLAGFKILGDTTTASETITEQGQEIDPEDTINVQPVVATKVNAADLTVTNEYAEAELYGLVTGTLIDGDEIKFLDDVVIDDGDELEPATLYTFTEDTTINVTVADDVTTWTVAVAGEAATVYDYVGTSANFVKIYTFEDEYSSLALIGDVAGALTAASIQTTEAISVSGTLTAEALSPLDYITLVGEGKVLTKTDPETLDGYIVDSDEKEIAPSDPVEGWYTYQIPTTPETGFMVIIAGKETHVDTLAEAIEKADADSTITFLSDATVDTLLTVNKNLTLDLNGNDMTGNGGTMFDVIDNALLTVNAEDSTITGVRFNVGKQISSGVGNDGKLALNGGSYSITDNTIVHVNGDCAACEVTITGAQLVSTNDNGVQFNGKGTYAIVNSTISGATAIYMKGGTLTIDATSEIVATKVAWTAPKSNRNGSDATGDAIVMDSNTAYKGLISLTVADGATVTTTATDAAAIRETITAGDESTTVKINAPQIANIALTPDFAKKVAEGTAELPGFVAVAGGKPYATLAAAVAAAQTTDTVALLANVTLTETLQITKATAINLAGKTVTFGDGLKNGIVTTEAAQELVISNGAFAVAGTRPAGGFAFQLYRVDALIKDVEMDLEGFEYGLEAETMLSSMSDNWTVPLAYEIVCENVDVKGNGSLFHFENVEATLDADCSAELKGTSFGGAHAAAIYSSCGALVTVEGGSYTHENALQTGNLGGDIIVEDGVFTGNIKSWMLDEDTRDFASVNKANITIKAGKFTGNFVYADGCTKDSQLLTVVISGGDFSDTNIPVEFIEEKEGYDASWVASETYANYVTPEWTLQKDFGGGTGDEADPYIIATEAHFEELQTKVAAGNAYAGKFFKLDADGIELTDWTGIGTSTTLSFQGVFNGNGKTLTVKYAVDGEYKGLFNFLNGVVSNMVIDASLNKVADGVASYGFGAVAGEAADATIENVTVTGSIGQKDGLTPTHNSSAFAAKCGSGNVLFKDCVNNASVYSAGKKAAGFVAAVSSDNKVRFVNCVNNGDVTVTGTDTTSGGAAGFIAYNGGSQADAGREFEGCTNRGVIKGDNVNVGSFVGWQNSNSWIVGLTGNTAQADIPAAGKVPNTKTTGFYFATVAGDPEVATFVADDALALNGSYKVMAPNATPTYEFTEAGTIAFDEALVAVKTFDGITADEDSFTLTPNKEGTITTFTCAVKSTDPREADPKTDDEVPAALANLGVSDLAKANIKTVAEFKAFEGYFAAKTTGVAWEDVTAGQKANAYLCYALNAAEIPSEEITDGDVTIDSFANGVIEIAIDGVVAGDEVTAAMIAKVIDIVGNNELTEMTTDKVAASGQATANGKVQVTVAPAEAIEDKSKFFYRASVKK